MFCLGKKIAHGKTNDDKENHFTFKNFYYYVTKAKFKNPTTKQKEEYAIRLVVKEDNAGNFFYDGDSTEMAKIKELQNDPHLVPNKGGSEAPKRSLTWYFKNVNDSSQLYSLKQSDSDYLKAVEDGDMETAQRMVDEAARKAGYTEKVYHGFYLGKKIAHGKTNLTGESESVTLCVGASMLSLLGNWTLAD